MGFSCRFFKEFVDYRTGYEETVFSIRRQSEGIYAIFHYLDFEKRNGRKHPEWEAKVRKMLDVFLQLQKSGKEVFPVNLRMIFLL